MSVSGVGEARARKTISLTPHTCHYLPLRSAEWNGQCEMTLALTWTGSCTRLCSSCVMWASYLISLNLQNEDDVPDPIVL